MPSQHDHAWDELLETLRSLIRKKLSKQIERQTRSNPNIPLQRIKEIEIGQWTESLQNLADEADENEEYGQRDMWEALIKCLPELMSEQ